MHFIISVLISLSSFFMIYPSLGMWYEDSSYIYSSWIEFSSKVKKLFVMLLLLLSKVSCSLLNKTRVVLALSSLYSISIRLWSYNEHIWSCEGLLGNGVDGLVIENVKYHNWCYKCTIELTNWTRTEVQFA